MSWTSYAARLAPFGAMLLAGGVYAEERARHRRDQEYLDRGLDLNDYMLNWEQQELGRELRQDASERAAFQIQAEEIARVAALRARQLMRDVRNLQRGAEIMDTELAPGVNPDRVLGGMVARAATPGGRSSDGPGGRARTVTHWAFGDPNRHAGFAPFD